MKHPSWIFSHASSSCFKSGALHVYGVAYSRDGKFVGVAGKGGGIGIHDAKTGKSVVSRRAGTTGMSVARDQMATVGTVGEAEDPGGMLHRCFDFLF